MLTRTRFPFAITLQPMRSRSGKCWAQAPRALQAFIRVHLFASLFRASAEHGLARENSTSARLG